MSQCHIWEHKIADTAKQTKKKVPRKTVLLDVLHDFRDKICSAHVEDQVKLQQQQKTHAKV